MDAMQFEPMSVGGILDKTFTLYRRNFLRFVTIVAVVQVPVALISLIWLSLLAQGVPAARPRTQVEASEPMPAGTDAAFDPGRDEEPSGGTMAAFGGGYVVLLLAAIVGNALCQAALARSVAEAYLGNETTVGQTFRFVLPKLLTLIGATLLVGLAVGVGIMLLVVPGVIFGLWLWLTTPSIVMENRGVISGMSRSKALTSGNLGKVFAVGFLATVIGIIITVPISWITAFASGLLFRDNVTLLTFASQFGGLVGKVLAAPIGAAAAILLYYDLRIRKEGFDLQMLAQSMASNQGQSGALRLPENA